MGGFKAVEQWKILMLRSSVDGVRFGDYLGKNSKFGVWTVGYLGIWHGVYIFFTSKTGGVYIYGAHMRYCWILTPFQVRVCNPDGSGTYEFPCGVKLTTSGWTTELKWNSTGPSFAPWSNMATSVARVHGDLAEEHWRTLDDGVMTVMSQNLQWKNDTKLCFNRRS